MAKDLDAFVHLFLDNIQVKLTKTVLWILKMAAIDCAHLLRWEIIDA